MTTTVTAGDDEYVIEELATDDVPVAELEQFKLVQIVDASQEENSRAQTDKPPIKQEASEAVLIQKFVQGECEFPDFYTKLEPLEDEDDENDEDDEQVTYDKADDELREQLPTTSQQAKLTQSKSGKYDIDTSDLDEEVRGSGGQFMSTKLRRLPTTYARRRSALNPALQGLMGEANLSYARGQIEIAEKICLEIIRQNPLAPEPFFTLAEIYETRDMEKYLNILTIAAHLNPHDRDQWIRVAELHIAQGDLQRARVFYTKAIRILYKDYDLRKRKALLLELMGETNAAMFTYLKMIPHLPAEDAEFCLMTAKNVARHFHSLNKHQFALEAMSSAYAVCAHLFQPEDLNLYMELLILNKQYEKVLNCLRERTNLAIETEQENKLELIFFCVIPDDFIPDFRSKLCVSLIHLHAHHLLGYLIQNVQEHIPVVEERLELYVDIAEALMQEHKYAEAIALLRPITDGEALECPAFVWLRQAECLRHLQRSNEAIESYTRVVEMAPFCYEAKFTLSALLKQQGRHVEAVKALEQSGEEEGQPLNARLLYERCIMLQQIGEIDEFLEEGYLLLGRCSIKLRNREEMFAAASGGSFYNAEGLKIILQMRNIAEDTDKALLEYNKPHQDNSDLTIEDEYQLFHELVRTAFAKRKFSFIERLCFAMVTTKRFVGFHTDLGRIIILACYFNNDSTIGFFYLRELISKNPGNISLWNLLSLMVQKGQDLRFHRYTRRLLQRYPFARQMRIFLAHYHLHCGSFKYALNIYVPLFKEQQQPFVALCISIIFSQLSFQRKVLRKTAAVAQAVAFIEKYAELRAVGGSRTTTADDTKIPATQQEIYYNIGRLYHQSGIVHLALEYYERGLAVKHPLIEEHERYLGLRHEIAFNTHLIYRASGNMLKARQYLYQYCIV